MKKSIASVIALSLFAFGCESNDIPQAHKGKMFDKTGALAFWAGGKGFTGPILGPGTYWTGIYDEVRLLDCSQNTHKEGLTALTKDGVQFTLDIYIRFSANCDNEEAINKLLATLSPATPEEGQKVQFPDRTINSMQLYGTFIRPAIGEAVRESVGPYIANEINPNRDLIFKKIRERFNEIVIRISPQVVVVQEMNLSNLDFPDQLEKANVARAEQAVLKDKAIAEREKVDAEIETAEKKKILAGAQGDVEAATIDKVGAALKRNPEYLQFQLQQSMPGIYERAGEKGNMIITAPNPAVLFTPKLVQPPQK